MPVGPHPHCKPSCKPAAQRQARRKPARATLQTQSQTSHPPTGTPEVGRALGGRPTSGWYKRRPVAGSVGWSASSLASSSFCWVCRAGVRCRGWARGPQGGHSGLQLRLNLQGSREGGGGARARWGWGGGSVHLEAGGSGRDRMPGPPLTAFDRLQPSHLDAALLQALHHRHGGGLRPQGDGGGGGVPAAGQAQGTARGGGG